MKEHPPNAILKRWVKLVLLLVQVCDQFGNRLVRPLAEVSNASRQEANSNVRRQLSLFQELLELIVRETLVGVPVDTAFLLSPLLGRNAAQKTRRIHTLLVLPTIRQRFGLKNQVHLLEKGVESPLALTRINIWVSNALCPLEG